MTLFCLSVCLVFGCARNDPVDHISQLIEGEIREVVNRLDLNEQAVRGIAGDDQRAVLAALHNGGICGKVKAFRSRIAFGMTSSALDLRK